MVQLRIVQLLSVPLTACACASNTMRQSSSAIGALAAWLSAKGQGSALALSSQLFCSTERALADAESGVSRAMASAHLEFDGQTTRAARVCVERRLELCRAALQLLSTLQELRTALGGAHGNTADHGTQSTNAIVMHEARCAMLRARLAAVHSEMTSTDNFGGALDDDFHEDHHYA